MQTVLRAYFKYNLTLSKCDCATAAAENVEPVIYIELYNRLVLFYILIA